MSRSTAGRPARFTKDQLARVALEIADREGFDAVSMRRVAQELGAGTMTLYSYVRTKDELIALMDDQLMADLLVTDEELARPWPESFASILRRTYRLRLRHPWSLTAMQDTEHGPNALRHAEQSLAALDGSPFTDEQKLTVLTVADSFVDGHALHRAAVLARQSGDRREGREGREQGFHGEASRDVGSDRGGGGNVGSGGADVGGAGAADLVEDERRMRELIETGAFPRINRTLPSYEDRRAQAGAWMDEAFEHGLAALLEGLAGRFGRG